MTSLTRDYVLGALREVIDPEFGYNIVDLELIYALELENGAIRISMTMTTPGCSAEDYIMSGDFERSRTLPGVQTVDIDLTWDPPWSTDWMSLAVKEHFGATPRKARNRG